MSRRARKRQSVGKKPWLGRVFAGILGLAVVSVVVGYVALRGYLHGDSFRKFLSGKVSQSTGVKGEFTPFSWQGLALETGGFQASGDGRLKAVNAQGLHTEVSLSGVRRGVWQIRNTVLDRLDVSLDTTAPSEPKDQTKSPAVKRAEKSPLLPDKVEISEIDLRNVTIKALTSSGLAVARGLRVKAEQSGGAGAYRAHISGGEFRLPWKHVPTLTLDQADVRYQDGIVYITDAQMSADGGGRIHAGGEWDTHEKALALDGSAEGFRCEKILTGNWAKRFNGEVSSTFNLQGKDGDLASAGEMKVTNGVLTALPVLDALAAYADTRRFRVINLSEAHTQWQWRKGELQLTNFVLASEGLLRLEGVLTIKDGKLDGRFMLGIAPGILSSIPGAEEDVFQPGEHSLLWTPLRVSGTVDDPEEDLTGRLIDAAGARMFEILPESGAKALKFSQTVLGESPDETIRKGEKLIKKGEKTLREASDILNGILGE